MVQTISHAQKQEIREVLAKLEVPVHEPSDERFFGAVVSYLLGATFDDTTHISAGVHVHGVSWEVDSQNSILVSVYFLEKALQNALAGPSVFVFTLEQQVQVSATVDYLDRHCPEKVVAAHALQLLQAVAALRKRPKAA